MSKVQGIYYRTKALVRQKEISKYDTARDFAENKGSYCGRKLLASTEANEAIYEMILSGKPFMAGRFGSTELLNMRSFEFGGFVGQKYDKKYYFNQLCEWSGFFPNDITLLPKFVEEMKSACKEVDFLAVWFNAFEDYYLKKIISQDAKICYLLDYEPWANDSVHWSSALKGKKVLVIHPFEETIKAQYKKRQFIFPQTDILPEFELHTVKAVQTLAGTKDDRFDNWFEALEWMYEEAMKIDFDIAIIGCGAYGLPLAAKIKRAGKQAIHLAGATQLLFGIKGKRWEEAKDFEYVRKWFNDSWVYPGEQDKIKKGTAVEGGCYWG